MTARSSAGDRPGFRSTSTPRRRKISTAAGESLSLIKTFGMKCARWLIVLLKPHPNPAPPKRGGGSGTTPSPRVWGRVGMGVLVLFGSLRRCEFGGHQIMGPVQPGQQLIDIGGVD